jgi:putative drug exporter of the RND superfamily
MFASLARFTYRRRWLVIGAWMVVLAAGFTYGPRVFDRLGIENGLRGDAESVRAAQRLDRLGGGGGGEVLVLVDGVRIDEPATKASILGAVRSIEAVDGVAGVLDGYRTPAPRLVASDRRAMLLRVRFESAPEGGRQNDPLAAVTARARAIDAPRVLVGGEDPARREFQDLAEEGLQRGELYSLPVVLVLLLVIFGGRGARRLRAGTRARLAAAGSGLLSVLLAAATPLALAAVAVAGAFLILLGSSYATDLSTYSVNVVTMVGLGLAVDYSLLVLSRFREERAAGLPVAGALEHTLATAGRTVAFSGLTVAVALTGLLLFAEPFLHSLAWGGIGVVIVAMLAAITLVPATLAAWGGRILPARPTVSDRGLFYRVSRLVQRHAVVIVLVVAAGLVLVAVPFRHARLENSGLEALPRSSESRQLWETTMARFPGAGTEPITVLVDIPPRSRELAAYVDRIERLPGVRSVEQRPLPLPTLAVVDVVPAGRDQGEVATRLVEQVRDLDRPAAAQITGPAAFLVDYRDSLLARIPFAFGLIALATLVLLFLMTGSLLVPVKAVLMNVLSLGASFGALVWVFQEGHLSGLLGFDPPGMVDVSVPVLIFVFAFGLSMDYEVFLISRIKEAYDEGIRSLAGRDGQAAGPDAALPASVLSAENDRAVALGLQRTGRIVTSAALLIVVVFLGFAVSELLTIKEVGLGMAIAVALDATVVRTLLVPATMKLMGRWNWWAPTWMRRLHEHAGLADHPAERAAASPTAATTPPLPTTEERTPVP